MAYKNDEGWAFAPGETRHCDSDPGAIHALLDQGDDTADRSVLDGN
jgi:hypothetical protein